MNIHRFEIERVTIYGTMEEINNATTFCVSNGFDIRQQGPRPLGGVNVDDTQFKIVAERKLRRGDGSDMGNGRAQRGRSAQAPHLRR